MALGSACMSPPPEAAARLSEVQEQGAQLERALESLEERFLGSQSNLQMWQELARRRQSVSEVACENLAEHTKGMARNGERQEVKARNTKRRVATATALGGGVATRSAKLRN
jgi:hypothetical protein